VEEKRTEAETLADMVEIEDTAILRQHVRLAACDLDLRVALQEVWDIAVRESQNSCRGLQGPVRRNPFTAIAVEKWVTERRDLQRYRARFGAS